MQDGPVGIKQLEPLEGAQVAIALPIDCMDDIRAKKHPWNVVQKQYSKYNENNTLVATPEGACMCVQYPAGMFASVFAPAV